jgi:hypothetical protein
MLIVYGLALYMLVGLIVAAAFVGFGVTQVLPPGTTVTTGARLLFLPGATALWPCVLIRWLTSGARR